MFLAISKAKFHFQKQAAITNKYVTTNTLSLRIHKTNHKVPTCGFLISLNQTQLRRQDIHMVYHWQFFFFSLKPHSNITGRNFVIKKVKLNHRFDKRRRRSCPKILGLKIKDSLISLSLFKGESSSADLER